MNSPIGEALQFDELLELPAEKTLVLTVNNRLSRGMTSRYSRALVQRSASLPVIQPWNAWLSQCAFDLTFTEPLDHDPLHVIDPTIARMLWAEVIRERDEQDG